MNPIKLSNLNIKTKIYNEASEYQYTEFTFDEKELDTVKDKKSRFAQQKLLKKSI